MGNSNRSLLQVTRQLTNQSIKGQDLPFKMKTELALDLIDEVRGRKLQDRFVLIDLGNGDHKRKPGKWKREKD